MLIRIISNHVITEISHRVPGYVKKLREVHQEEKSKIIPFRTDGFPAGVQYAFGMHFWELLAQNEALRNALDETMALRHLKGRVPWFKKYPIADRLRNDGLEKMNKSDQPVFIDVGGGRCHDIINFKKEYPKVAFRYVLQDLPETLNKTSTDLKDIEQMDYDFFQPQPILGKSSIAVPFLTT